MEITFFQCGRFILVGMKYNKAEVVDEYCWLITLAEGWSYCGQSVSSVLEFRFHPEALTYTIRIQNSNLLHKLGSVCILVLTLHFKCKFHTLPMCMQL
jgi:hypothetical protein